MHRAAGSHLSLVSAILSPAQMAAARYTAAEVAGASRGAGGRTS